MGDMLSLSQTSLLQPWKILHIRRKFCYTDCKYCSSKSEDGVKIHFRVCPCRTKQKKEEKEKKDKGKEDHKKKDKKEEKKKDKKDSKHNNLSVNDKKNESTDESENSDTDTEP